MRTTKYLTDTDENKTLTSQLIHTVSDLPRVSDSIKERPGNIFYKRLGIKSDFEGGHIVVQHIRDRYY